VLRETKMKELGAPTVLRQVEIEIGNGRKQKMNEKGRYLVPHALEYEKTIAKKDQTIKDSLFGVFFEAINDLDAFYKGMQKRDPTINPFKNEEIDQSWKKFTMGLENNDKMDVVESLLEILRFVFGNLLWTDFPRLSDDPLRDVLEA